MEVAAMVVAEGVAVMVAAVRVAAARVEVAVTAEVEVVGGGRRRGWW